ncbi:pectin lyase-like protein [Anaeromyces robustus]|uniref:Pectinesterase n=1 Tax=Anaeromyces robustus TaxID=1754192 RepID=A0A1Y1XH57_9FUNG|nr:pectin lyase-like protein [Anaeromyces robustus]|eukprot:ORX85022.1 pectin lyase-like protein [Anaeromyces robustus]
MKLYISLFITLIIQLINAFPQNQLPSDAVIVAKDGSGKFNTVQAAVDSLPNGNSEKVIYIKSGTYNEQVSIQKNFVTLIGENKDKVIITYNLNNAKTGSSSECATVKAKCDNFKAFDITFENTAPFPGDNAQAPAFYSYGNKHYIENCNFLSYQDTLLSYHGTQYFKNCYIRGLTDFIWGFGRAVFDQCTLHVVSKGGKNEGYLTANGNEDPNFKEGGFLITNSKVTSDGARFYLGRLWKKNCYVIFDKTNFPGDKIVKEGWLTFTGNDAYKNTSKVGEHQCSGNGYNTNGRVSWSTQFPSAPSISEFLGGDLSFTSSTVYKGSSGNNTTPPTQEVPASNAPASNPAPVPNTPTENPAPVPNTPTENPAPVPNTPTNNNNNNGWGNWGNMDWSNWGFNNWGNKNSNSNTNGKTNNNNNWFGNNNMWNNWNPPTNNAAPWGNWGNGFWKRSAKKVNKRECLPLNAQCGGKGYKGPSCCQEGKCTVINEWYSTCI